MYVTCEEKSIVKYVINCSMYSDIQDTGLLKYLTITDNPSLF